jgi:hypothetical protein
MTGTTISSYTTANLVLTQASQNPVTITATGTIHTAAPNGIDGAFGSAWTIDNYGAIIGNGRSGVYLASGGNVTNGASNATSALITGGTYGVVILGAAGTVANDGTIIASKYSVLLESGGSVVNGSSGDTTALITSNNVGVKILGGPSTVANYGTIYGGRVAAYLRSGGSLVNGSSSDTAASIRSGDFGISVSFGVGTISNFGTISGSAGYGINGGSMTVTNRGSIAGDQAGIGVLGIGSVINNAAGQITGSMDGIVASVLIRKF